MNSWKWALLLFLQNCLIECLPCSEFSGGMNMLLSMDQGSVWRGPPRNRHSSSFSHQPPRGAAWAPSACGAGVRRGRAGAASPRWRWWSWLGCSGRPPSWPTSPLARVLVSGPPPSPLPAAPQVLSHLRLHPCSDRQGACALRGRAGQRVDLRRQAPPGAAFPAAGRPAGPHAGRHAGGRCRPGALLRKQLLSPLSLPPRSLSGPSPRRWARR